KPKGVKMPNNGMVNLLLWQQKQFQNKNRRVLQFASLNFDVSFQEIFSTLCFGSTLHLIQSDRRTDMAEILKDIHRYAITHLFIPYIVLKNFVEHIHAHNCRSLPLEEIITAGEQLKLTNDIYDWMQKSSIKIINQYGPTEAHVVSSYTIDSNSVLQQLPPIGKPIDNTRLYVLSNTHELMPIGVAGELYIGGVQVAQGYLNQPELTSNKFIPDPFSEKPGARLYKSGDLACWLPDGNIEYLGRIDDQVKIRGYRIELGEIESILQECPLVKQGVILAKENSSGHKQLIGYVIPEGEFNKEALLAYLEEKLPKYMVPSLWVEMENLPVTANGKINKKALPDPYTEDLSSSSYIAPRNPIETKLAGIWQEVLKVNKVSIHDNFFELGGHSLLTMRLIAAVRRRLELEMIVKDLFAHSTVATLAVHLQKQQRGLTLPVISLQSRPERISLSFNQDRLWFIDRLQGSVQYHLPMAFKLTGRLDKNALASALQTIVNRHQVLRTVIQQDENGKPYQHIKEKNHWQLNVVENKLYRHSSDSLQQYIEQLINEPFDLSSDDMLRAHLISLNEEEYVLIATMHHIASDGWSTSVFIKELAALYKAFEENGPISLPPLELQYADYALWQRRYLQGELLEKKLAYWKEKLSGVSPLQLPTDLVRPAVQSSLGTVAEFHLDIKVSKALQQLSQQQGTTLFMTLLAAFKVLLYRYSGQEDICVGSVAADRQQPEVEQLIGFFINTLTLRSEVKGNLSFTDLLQQVKATILEAYEYGDVPFEKVVEATVKERDLSRNPLFDVMFVWQNTPPVAERFLGEVELTQYAFAYNKTKFDITFTITETDNGLHGIVEYCTDLYTLQTMNRMFGHYEELLVSIIKDPGQKVSTLPMLTSVERHQLLEEFNATTSPYPWDKTIVQLFEDQVRESPSAVAIVFEDEQLTYQQLNERANQLAGYLRSKGVGIERLLPICIERSIEMIVGILGILKAGAAYVPIDPEYPQERISYMLQDTGATLVLTSNGTSAMLPQVAGVEMIDINTAELTQEPTGNLQVSISPGNLAYVIYTSGSTGKPKGVPVEHQAYLNINTCYHKILQGEQTILTCNYVFDVSVLEIFSTLLGGGCLNIPQPTVIFDPATFAQFLYQRKISAAYIHPMYLNDVAIALEDYSECYLQKILIGVEPIRKEAVQWYLQNKISIINGYGPTETTICASFYLVDKNVSQYSPLPIGRPVANTQIYILDEVGQLCPVGVAGQLCIGGVQVARGYLNRPELTGEKFIQDPFRTGGRVYRTGDLGRWLPDGNIEYLGRMDDQVKIRGYRIELGEIESVIQESGFTKQVVVLAKQEANEPKQLVGYVVSEGNFDREGMIAYLKDKLPYYMIPSLWVEIEKLPLTINGKVDKKALSALNSGYHPSGHRFVAPQTETEVRLADIWKELLGIEQVGIHDNFFELGGHSLLVMRQSASIERNFLVSVPVRVLFQFTSISELGKYLEIQLRNYSAEQHTKGYQLFNI
ncbi:MAG TPA: amino acid adenylation domain-containing protein, partial [Flavisolibacter sp.]|nr:amino acid adenylation domain-containing protein [Flavisolibacter sp.]